MLFETLDCWCEKVSFWWKTLILFHSDCKKESEDMAFLWQGIVLLIVLLWVGLAAVEGIAGDTKAEEKLTTIGQRQLEAIDVGYTFDSKCDYKLVRTCSWRSAISANWLKLFDLLGNTAYLTVISATTVGFGDVVPTTILGRLIAGADAIVGLLAFGLYINVISGGLRAYRRRVGNSDGCFIWAQLRKQPSGDSKVLDLDQSKSDGCWLSACTRSLSSGKFADSDAGQQPVTDFKE